jgi:hypothetical protein
VLLCLEAFHSLLVKLRVEVVFDVLHGELLVENEAVEVCVYTLVVCAHEREKLRHYVFILPF